MSYPILSEHHILMAKFREYDVVRVVRLPPPTTDISDHGFREVRIGDLGTIVMAYSKPEGYTVECVSADGSTEWLIDFRPDDLEQS